ncbi:MAG TPA: hypothetical protein VGB42_02515 [Candidatus Thermoplasmatota archaeon]
MSGGEAPPRAGRPAADAADYERRLRAGMRLMSGKDRDAVSREIMGGVHAQAAARGGGFAAIAGDLDDPRWVGRQMVRVYGVAAPWLVACVALAVALALSSAPGALVGPATEGPAVAASLAGFAALLAVLFALLLSGMARLASYAAAAAVATRLAALALPQEGVALLDLLSAGELSLYLLATLLLLVVAGVPALALRLRAGDD